MGRAENRKNKNKNSNINNNNKVIEKKVESTEYDQVSLLIKIIIGLSLIITGTYLILCIFVTKEISLFNNNNNIETEAQINYSKILASETFSQLPTEYYVVIYDFTSTDSDLIDYTLANTLFVTPYYYVNSIDEFNSKFIGDEEAISNPNASNFEELTIIGPTLIRISNGINVDYIEGIDEIIEYLENLAPSSDD